MYHIENHHEAIIDKEMWNQVQTILSNRAKQFNQRLLNKSKKKNSKNRAFEKKLYCGECGNLIGHYRYVSNNKESNNWKCNHARRYYLKDKCTAPGFQQEYIELNFMKLKKLRHYLNFVKNLENLMRCLIL